MYAIRSYYELPFTVSYASEIAPPTTGIKLEATNFAVLIPTLSADVV